MLAYTSSCKLLTKHRKEGNHETKKYDLQQLNNDRQRADYPDG